MILFWKKTAVVVFDEFHERSLDSDLALALFSSGSQGASPGSTDYRNVGNPGQRADSPLPGRLPDCGMPRAPPSCCRRVFAIPAVRRYRAAGCRGSQTPAQHTAGDILVFLPGVGEIRRTEDLLAATAQESGLALMPLYGDLPLAEQRLVLAPCRHRKVVLATNVAETSLTISGITGVVDTGSLASTASMLAWAEPLQIERISKASAEQRAGRAGREAAGACLRLWTEREHQSMRDFEAPELPGSNSRNASCKCFTGESATCGRSPGLSHRPPEQSSSPATLEGWKL